MVDLEENSVNIKKGNTLNPSTQLQKAVHVEESIALFESESVLKNP
uniref:Uncharacterized protein n=1 Tax=Wolbachia endosymbiont of Aleurodicus dispersus TaxID=1288877 RepID=A0A3B0JC34_9RICK